MKKFLLLCLLGLGMLAPTNTITAKEHAGKKIIKVIMENQVYLASSEPADGPITHMDVKTLPGGVCVASTDCGDYNCSLDVSQLPSGSYVLRVYTTYRMFEKQFKK